MFTIEKNTNDFKLKANTISDIADYYLSNNKNNFSDVNNKSSFSIHNYDLKSLQKKFEDFQIQIDNLFSHNSDINECIKILERSIHDKDQLDFIKTLDKIINDHINTPTESTFAPLNFYSFKQLILFSVSSKIQKSEVRIDLKTGNFCLYHSDKNDHKSRKISLVFNEKDIIYSVLSRDYGLAKLSGRFTLKQPVANHKIDLLMDLFKF